MCFSASASFTASALLALAGAAVLSRVKKHNEYMFALIPLLFAAQQFSEGVLWLSFMQSRFFSLQIPALYIFLFFAFVIWPFWIPISLYKFHEYAEYRNRLVPFLALGIIVSVILLGYLVLYGATANSANHHIAYTTGISSQLSLILSLIYLCATVVPFFVIPHRGMYLIGTVMGISYLISMWFYAHAFISIWCFFAALLSILIFIIV